MGWSGSFGRRCARRTESPASALAGMESLKPLPPLEPLPPLWTEKLKRRVLGWATVVAVLCAIGIGMLHGLGNKIFDAVWMVVVRGRG